MYNSNEGIEYFRNPEDYDLREWENSEPGWYYWYCQPGCLPDSEPIGPFETLAQAHTDAIDNSGIWEE